MTTPERFFVSRAATLRETMQVIDRGAKGIALVVDADGRLEATITDGDVRRAILSGANLDASIERLLTSRDRAGQARPVTAADGTPARDLQELMLRTRVRQVPVLDGRGRVVDLTLLDDLVTSPLPAPRAIVMAGGRGSRLHPLTATTPKPMLPVGDRPLLERIIDQLRESGIRRIEIATHHLAGVIRSHFGDGASFGVQIGYVDETEPLGTAGALGLLPPSGEPWLVVNGDVVTDVDFGALATFHAESSADATIAVRSYDIDVPYGLVSLDGSRVTGVREKPRLRHFVAAGIYLLGPRAQRLVPHGVRQDMPVLIESLVKEGLNVVAFPIHEYWIDIGRHEDYQRAEERARSAEHQDS